MKKSASFNFKKSAWKIGGLLCAALLVSTPFARAKGSKPIASPETKVVAQVEEAPKDWLAFLSYQGGFKAMESYVLDQTPYIMLFQDGRLFWRDDNIKYDAPNRRRDMWREAKISPQTLGAFSFHVGETEFLTIQKPEEVAPKPDKNGVIQLRPQICDAATTVLGFREAVTTGKDRPQLFQERVISEYALGAFGDEDKDNPYIQSLLRMEKLLQNLRPKESKRYEPDSIRVSFMDANTRGAAVVEPGTIVPAWPLADVPKVDEANIYSGADAKKLVEILSEKPIVKIGDAVYTTIWTPAIAVPASQPEPVKPVVSTPIF